MEKRSVSWASPEGLSLLAQRPFYGFWSRLRWMAILASLRPIARLPFTIQPVAEGEQLCEEWWL